MAKDQAYYEAEKKIEIARRSGAAELDLSSMNLTELPESIGQLTQLRKLDLGYYDTPGEADYIANYLTTLPESLGQLTSLQTLILMNNLLTILPEWLGKLTQLTELIISDNRLTTLPEWLGQLSQLSTLIFSGNEVTRIPRTIGNLKRLRILHAHSNLLRELPDEICQLVSLETLSLGGQSYYYGINRSEANPFETIPHQVFLLHQLKHLIFKNCRQITAIPNEISQLTSLKTFDVSSCNISDLPPSLAQLKHLERLDLNFNPLNPELAKAYEQGLDGVRAYLRAKATAQITLNEAKLILVGEGEVGKTCLMDALLGRPWREHFSTHGIEIQSFKVTDQESKKEITINGWDFGGQRVYRPTHQLFFSAPAVYLVVWKPREGSQAGQVKEWIQLVKRRESTAKILVVATHGGPQQRQPDIDRQELWDLFGRETIVDFFFVNNKPDENGKRKGIEELKQAIAKIAAQLPEVGRSVPKSFADVRKVLQDKGMPYLPLQEVLDICHAHKMDDEIAKLFITISHHLGYLTHFENDPTLHDIVILRPDWLATAMSYVLDDEETRAKHGFVNFSRLSHLWNDPARAQKERYSDALHPIFLRLMERFDLSYRVADPYGKNKADPISLIGQLVPDVRPSNLAEVWGASPSVGDIQQTQICRIVDANNSQPAHAEGLFYQLIVRLHKYSLGRVDYKKSVHWQHGLVLEDEYQSCALLEQIGNDIRITVRSPFPEGLLSALTREVKYLVESFWEGLRCNIMVPCIEPCGNHAPGTGLFEVEKLITSKRKGKDEFPCSVCGEWQNIDLLLRNASTIQPGVTALISAEFAEVKAQIESVRQQALFNTNQIHITGNVSQSNIIIGNENNVDNLINYSPIRRFDGLDSRTRRILSQVDKTYTDLLQVFTDEAKEGPRLFSFFPVDHRGFNHQKWIHAKFRFVLWCEHSRLPLPVLNGADSTKGVYDLELDREWFKKFAPYLKFLNSTLNMVLPVASSSIKLNLDETAYKLAKEQLDFSKSFIDVAIANATNLEHDVATWADGSILRELHTMFKSENPDFGGLIRVINMHGEFLWVHEKFASEY